jgi:hypothetical protein
MSRSRDQTLAISYSRKVVPIYWLMPHQKLTSPESNVSTPRRTRMFISTKPFENLSERAERWSCKINISAVFGTRARPDRKLVRVTRERERYTSGHVLTRSARASDYTDPGDALTTPTAPRSGSSKTAAWLLRGGSGLAENPRQWSLALRALISETGGQVMTRKKETPAEDTGALRKDDRENWGRLIVLARRVIEDALQRIDPDQPFEGYSSLATEPALLRQPSASTYGVGSDSPHQVSPIRPKKDSAWAIEGFEHLSGVPIRIRLNRDPLLRSSFSEPNNRPPRQHSRSYDSYTRPSLYHQNTIT